MLPFSPSWTSKLIRRSGRPSGETSRHSTTNTRFGAVPNVSVLTVELPSTNRSSQNAKTAAFGSNGSGIGTLPKDGNVGWKFTTPFVVTFTDEKLEL